MYLCPQLHTNIIWINTTLGGRFLIAEVYPYSFKEFLAVQSMALLRLFQYGNGFLKSAGKSCILELLTAYGYNSSYTTPQTSLTPLST